MHSQPSISRVGMIALRCAKAPGPGLLRLTPKLYSALPKPATKYVFFCSEIAAVTGRHKYQKPGDILARMWHQQDPVGFGQTAEQFGISLKSVEKELAEKDPEGELRNLVDTTGEAVRDPEDIKSAEELVRKSASDRGVDAAIVEELVSEIKRTQGSKAEESIVKATERKTRQEPALDVVEQVSQSVADALAEDKPEVAQASVAEAIRATAPVPEAVPEEEIREAVANVTSAPEEMRAEALREVLRRASEHRLQHREQGRSMTIPFRPKEPWDGPDLTVVIYGRVDGVRSVIMDAADKERLHGDGYKKVSVDGVTVNVDTDGPADGIASPGNEEKEIVEIKHRVRHLFPGVPGYERVQLQLYIRLFGCTKGRLVQSFRGQSSEHPLADDEEFFQAICQDLSSAAALVYRCVEGDAEAKQQVLKRSGFKMLKERKSRSKLL
eukprot:TRINITY_DN44503_c0_g1_i1.p1 TRINITY_DN44503_c0_g1~~TRINITY_DN44503_c0_g1_i1.p1  ORF type:complete len:440 (-),score=57.78 TRINITY_DN44503_c0_g1_i1:325-1644(-)